VLVLWALAIVLEAWTPPIFVAPGRRELTWEVLVPFLAYYRRTDIHALADVIDQTMRYVPLGALLAPGAGGMSTWPAVAIGLGVGLVLEAGQFFLANRTPEITDALTGAVGSWIGFRLARYAAYLIAPPDSTRPQTQGSSSEARRVTTHPAGQRPRPSPERWLDDVMRFADYAIGRATARISKGWHPTIELVVSGLSWLDKQSYGARVAAVCAAVVIFMCGLLLLCRVLGWI
jgi:VanZ family protein